MAAGTLPKPGSKFGPCLDACQHKDCAQTRADAVAKCPICGRAIGYSVEFYRVDTTLHHARCLEELAE